jgi:hypothetical protein
MGKEQEAVARAGGGAAADEVLKGAGDAGQGGDEAGGPGGSSSGQGGEGGDAASDGGAGGGSSSRGGRGGSQQAGSTAPDSGAPPEEQAASVKGCNDTEKVARQLCEAATAEQDPFLRAALWDEYNEYKKILARQ